MAKLGSVGGCHPRTKSRSGSGLRGEEEKRLYVEDKLRGGEHKGGGRQADEEYRVFSKPRAPLSPFSLLLTGVSRS